ncbi:hypothetical protein [Sporocytophaga myxococcoides]|uniref:hypothetical protein n=1 Tax=Sporocytophaga myxococcoides TaxID=153721 RepID=UPI00048E8D31|nr:hypothetical protein [Sporocytophaga myxococcoides]
MVTIVYINPDSIRILYFDKDTLKLNVPDQSISMLIATPKGLYTFFTYSKMNLIPIYFLFLILSGRTSCNAHESKLKSPAFDNKDCLISIPIDKGYKEFIKEKDGILLIDKSEFKDSTYMLYLPQSNLPSLVITV